MGSILLDNVKVGSGSLVAAGSLVPVGMEIPPGSRALGSPARVKRPVTDEERAWIASSAAHYVTLTRTYLDA